MTRAEPEQPAPEVKPKAAAPLVVSVRYVASGARVSGVTATQQAVAGASETWLLAPLPPGLVPKVNDTFHPMGIPDRRTRTVTAATPATNGAYELTCSVPAP